MDFPIYSPLDQVDMAVDLGVLPPPLPDILTFRQLTDMAPVTPPEIIEGILHQGCKMILGGTSKSNKTWALLDLGLSVAAGADWWGHRTTQGNVLYINFEIHDWAMCQRLNTICLAKTSIQKIGDTFHVWNLRGRNTDLAILRPMLEEQLRRHTFSLIILDPAYKLLGDRDENSNGEIANLMNEFESICRSTRAAIVIAHHFAKGDSSSKAAGDRLSGAGAWTRDPDAILVLTPHEEDDCFVCAAILRNHARLPEFCLAWDYPLMTIDTGLDPSQIRRPQSKNKKCEDSDFIPWVTKLIGTTPKAFKTIVDSGLVEFGLSESSTQRRLNRLCDCGVMHRKSGVYWMATT